MICACNLTLILISLIVYWLLHFLLLSFMMKKTTWVSTLLLIVLWFVLSFSLFAGRVSARTTISVQTSWPSKSLAQTSKSLGQKEKPMNAGISGLPWPFKCRITLSQSWAQLSAQILPSPLPAWYSYVNHCDVYKKHTLTNDRTVYAWSIGINILNGWTISPFTTSPWTKYFVACRTKLPNLNEIRCTSFYQTPRET